MNLFENLQKLNEAESTINNLNKQDEFVKSECEKYHIFEFDNHAGVYNQEFNTDINKFINRIKKDGYKFIDKYEGFDHGSPNDEISYIFIKEVDGCRIIMSVETDFDNGFVVYAGYNEKIPSDRELFESLYNSIEEDVDLPDYNMLKRDVDYLAHMVPIDIDPRMIYNQIRVIDSAFDNNNNISESQYNELMQIMNKIKNKKFGESVKENVEEDSGLKVCRHCLDAIISREGRQNVVNTYEFDSYDEDAEPLVCEWCDEEVDKLYEIG